MSVSHFKEFAEAVIALKKPTKNAFVVDIGSNIGTLLSHFKTMGFENVLGVEPSGNISALAIAAGVPTLTDFLLQALSGKFRRLRLSISC